MSNCLLHHDTFSHSLAVLARLPVPQRDGWLPSRASVTSRGGFADSGRRIKLLGDCIKCSKASGEASKIGVGVTEIVTLCMWVWVCFFLNRAIGAVAQSNASFFSAMYTGLMVMRRGRVLHLTPPAPCPSICLLPSRPVQQVLEASMARLVSPIFIKQI